MEKPAPTKYPLHDVIRRRWSPRAFADRPVDETTLNTLLEAAAWAPSCFSDEPWFYIVARKENPEEFTTLLSCLVEKNVQWAKLAPVLMISVARLHFKANGKPNRFALHDVGAATENLTLQAVSMGLAIHQMGGFSVDKARDVYDIPAEFEPVAAIALGYPGDPDILSEALREREKASRDRKQLSEFVYSAHWGHSAPWAK